MVEHRIQLGIEAVMWDKNQKACTLVLSRVIGNEIATARFNQLKKAGFEEFAKHMVIESCAALEHNPDARIRVLSNATPTEVKFAIGDPKTGVLYEFFIRARRLGIDNGKNMFLHLGNVFNPVARISKRSLKRLTPEQSERLAAVLRTPIPASGDVV